MQVIFNASGNQVHHERLAIDVEDRAPEVHPQGVLIDLAGESCIPGINTDDVEGIFEEHAIKKDIDLSCIHGTVYGVTDKVSAQTRWTRT
jgi:hydrocephalus-inducing protein